MALWILFLAALPCDDVPFQSPLPKFVITTIAGTGELGFSGDGGPATKARIQRPTAVALDSEGNVYIADEANFRIRMVTVDGRITTVAGTGRSQMQDQDYPATETNLISAYGVATDYDDNLYVLSRGHGKIFRIDADGMARRIVGTGESGYGGDGGPAIDAKVRSPNHLVVDEDANLIIADTGNHRIRRVTPEGIIDTIAGDGTPGFAGDGGPALKARFAGLSAIAMDEEGNIFVADFNNHRIRKITTDGIIQTIAGNGSPEFNGDGKNALESQIGEPCGVAVDQEGNVFIGDQINCRVRMVTPDGIMHTIAGNGIAGLTGDGGPSTLAQTSNPDIIAVNDRGDVFIPDHINGVVRKLTRVR